tara:strand:- start:232 stop:891 length:660 start_codon:yes stop_codon:yes gene_type:complete
MQRLADIILSLIALFLLSPIFLVTVVVLRFTGEGEVFYKQLRVGRSGNNFGILKFATMLKNSPSMGTGTITVANDSRVLPLGRILRKTKVNELPQLINIFLGDMSIIGPRPLTSETFSAYSQGTQDLIKLVRPGLSGVGSIVFRNEESLLSETDNSSSFYSKKIAPYKGRLESWYISHQSIFLYFSLIIITLWVVIFPSSKIFWKVFPSIPKPPKYLSL